MRTLSRLCVAGTLAALATGAYAQVLTPPGASDTLPIAGATSTEPLVASALLDATVGMCTDNAAGSANEADVYTTEATFGNAPSKSTLYANFAVVCVGNAHSGLSGTTIEIIKNTGSSATSYDLGTNTPYPDSGPNDAHWAATTGCTPAGTEAGGTTAGVPDSNIGRIHYRVFVNCGNLGAVVPKVGITDVESSLFLAASAITQAQANTTTQYPQAGQGWVDVPFAPIVSIPFYKALQAAQLSSTQLAACQGTGGPQNVSGYPLLALQTEACVPSLTKSQIAAILYGTGQNPYLTAASFPNLTPPPSDTNIYLCRRSNTSGTEAAFNAYFMGFGCTQGATTIQSAIDTVDFTNTAANRNQANGHFVWGNGTTSGVRACVANRTSDGVGVDQWALGIISFDQVPDDTENGQFRYIKVDGVTPNLENIVRGAWNFYEENFLQIPKSGVSTNTLTADQTTLYQNLSKVVQSTGATSVSEVQEPYGLQGYLLRPTSTLSPVSNVTTTNVKATPVNSSVKALTFTGATNNCLPPFLQFNTSAVGIE